MKNVEPLEDVDDVTTFEVGEVSRFKVPKNWTGRFEDLEAGGVDPGEGEICGTVTVTSIDEDGGVVTVEVD